MMEMACKMKSELVHFLYDEVSPEEKQKIKDHLSLCAECREELDLLIVTKDLLNECKEVVPSEAFQKSLSEKISVCEREEVSDWDCIKLAFFSMIKTLSPAICGILVTTIMVSVLSLSGDILRSQLNPLSLIICGVFWSGIYSMVFDLAIKSSEKGICMRRLLGLNLRRSVYYTFLALLFGIGLLQYSPFMDFWHLQAFAVGFLPLFVCSSLLSRKVTQKHILHGICLAVLYILLLGPALYMQCLSSGFTLYILMITISSLGALAGGIAGAWAVSHMIFQPGKN